MRSWTGLVVGLGIVLLTGCSAGTRPFSESRPQYPAPNLHEDVYDPGEDWTLAWSDEFEGEAVDAGTWNRQVVPPGRFNGEWQRYTASHENAYIDEGCLVIKAIHESDSHGMGQYTSARLNTAGKKSFRFGKVAARIQLPYGPGLWPAFWLLGANIDENGGDTPWPQAGEIDIMEFYGSRDHAVVEANLHYADRAGRHADMGAKKFRLHEGRFPEAFHVFELEWTPKQLTWFVDGEEYASTSIAGPEFSEYRKNMFILLNIAVGGRHSGRPNEHTFFPQTMYVDWVRVYRQRTQFDRADY